MIDAIKTTRTWLLGESSITDIAGQRVYGGPLPEIYNAEADGHAITINVRGGSAHSEIPLVEPSLQIECWGPQLKYADVNALAGLVYDALHGKNMLIVGDVAIKSSICEVLPQPSTDPDTGWANNVAFYRMLMAPVSG